MRADCRARRRCQPLRIELARRMVTLRSTRSGGSWTGSWTGTPGNPSAVSAISAIVRVIGAASAHGGRGRSSHNPPAVGSSPTRPICGYTLYPVLLVDRFVDRGRRSVALVVVAWRDKRGILLLARTISAEYVLPVEDPFRATGRHRMTVLRTLPPCWRTPPPRMSADTCALSGWWGR